MVKSTFPLAYVHSNRVDLVPLASVRKEPVDLVPLAGEQARWIASSSIKFTTIQCFACYFIIALRSSTTINKFNRSPVFSGHIRYFTLVIQHGLFKSFSG